jgi:DtxR family Mn-dependent transcriptional regulator
MALVSKPRRSSSRTAAAPAHTEIVDHYLETIFYIANEGEVVRPGRIAEWLGVSAPTVSVTLRRLADEGWIRVAGDRSVSLTRAGAKVAEDVVRGHRLAERWLVDVLGLDWATADVEAQRLAPGFSPEVVERLDESLGHPDTCPHGNVIPGRQAPYERLIALADLGPGTPALIRRISEVAEHDAPQLLRQLDALGLYPGVSVAVAEGDRGFEALSIHVGDGVLALGTEAARSLWVEPQA